MTLPIPCIMAPAYFAADNPTVRVTRGATSTVTLSINAGELYWPSGDASVLHDERDLLLLLQDALRTVDASFVVSLTDDGFVTITCGSAFSILWGDVLTTIDPALFGFVAASTASGTSVTSSQQVKGYWTPDVPATHDSEDEPIIVGGVVPTGGEGARGSSVSTIYERRIEFSRVLRPAIRTSEAPADRPYGTLEWMWLTGGLGLGGPVRYYADKSARTTTSYAVYRVAENHERPWERAKRTKTFRFDVLISLVRVAQPNAFSNTLSTLLDAVDEYMSVPDSASLDLVSEMTVSLWVRATGAWAASQTVIGKWLANTQNSWRIDTGSGASLRYYIASSLVDTGSNFGAIAFPSAGAWHHHVMVFNGAGAGNAQRLRVWHDGVEVSLAYTGTIPASIPAGTAILGVGASSTPSRYFGGNLDEVAIYDAALTADEVTEIYNRGRPGDLAVASSSPRLVSWWRMGDGDAHPTVRDQIGTNHGTLTNTEAGDFVAAVPP